MLIGKPRNRQHSAPEANLQIFTRLSESRCRRPSTRTGALRAAALTALLAGGAVVLASCGGPDGPTQEKREAARATQSRTYSTLMAMEGIGPTANSAEPGAASARIASRSQARFESLRLDRLRAQEALQHLEPVSGLDSDGVLERREVDLAYERLNEVSRFGFGRLSLYSVAPFPIDADEHPGLDLQADLERSLATGTAPALRGLAERLPTYARAMDAARRRVSLSEETGPAMPVRVRQRLARSLEDGPFGEARLADTLATLAALKSTPPVDAEAVDAGAVDAEANNVDPQEPDLDGDGQTPAETSPRARIDLALAAILAGIESEIVPAQRRLEAVLSRPDVDGVAEGERLNWPEGYYAAALALAAGDLAPADCLSRAEDLVASFSTRLDDRLDDVAERDMTRSERLAVLIQQVTLNADPEVGPQEDQETDEGFDTSSVSPDGALPLDGEVAVIDRVEAQYFALRAPLSLEVAFRDPPVFTVDSPVFAATEPQAPAFQYTPGQAGEPVGEITINAPAFEALAPLTRLPALLMQTLPGREVRLDARANIAGAPDDLAGAIDNIAYDKGWDLHALDIGELALAGRLSELDETALEFARLRLALEALADSRLHTGQLTLSESDDLFVTRLGMDAGEASTITDRLVVRPGQACAAMHGRDVLRELRSAASVRLGAGFDARAFHRAILAGGSMPPELLVSRMADWVETEARASGVE